jgi:hypothetical protein
MNFLFFVLDLKGIVNLTQVFSNAFHNVARHLRCYEHVRGLYERSMSNAICNNYIVERQEVFAKSVKNQQNKSTLEWSWSIAR